MPEAASPVFLLKGGEVKMIDVTKVNGKKFTLNSRLIETIEETPDTVITLTTGKKMQDLQSFQKSILEHLYLYLSIMPGYCLPTFRCI